MNSMSGGALFPAPRVSAEASALPTPRRERRSHIREAAMTIILLGGLLVTAGVLFMTYKAIWRGRLSSRKPPMAPDGDTLEPRGPSEAFDVRANWPGLALFALGSILLLVGAAT
jgi:hypothetical protein